MMQEATKERVWKLHQDGFRAAHISVVTGYPVPTIHAYLSKMRREAGIPPKATGFAVTPPHRPKLEDIKQRKLIAYAGKERGW